MDLIDKTGLRKSVGGFGECYEKLVKEFIVNIPKDCVSPMSKEFKKVFVCGKCLEFSPEVINRFLGRNEEACVKFEVTNNQICKEITTKQVKQWGGGGCLLAS